MISVVIPVYNNLPYLEDCFRSVFEQDGDVEMIIVDDGSDDGSEIVCKRYSGFPRVRYIRTDRVGISCARNAGIRESSGEYISFLDSDDMLLPGTLMTLLKMLERHPKCGIAVGQYIRKEIASPANSMNLWKMPRHQSSIPYIRKNISIRHHGESSIGARFWKIRNFS